MKHIFGAASAVVALGLMVSCGSDDFGLTAERRSGIDSTWEKQSSFERDALCESLETTDGRLEAFDEFEEYLLDAEPYSGIDNDEAEAERQAEAEAMVKYVQTKC